MDERGENISGAAVIPNRDQRVPTEEAFEAFDARGCLWRPCNLIQATMQSGRGLALEVRFRGEAGIVRLPPSFVRLFERPAGYGPVRRPMDLEDEASAQEAIGVTSPGAEADRIRERVRTADRALDAALEDGGR